MKHHKQELRQYLRSLRHAILAPQSDAAADNLSLLVLQLPLYSAAKKIAFYWPHDHEISTLPLLSASLHRQKKCFLPALVLGLQQKLVFAEYTDTTPLIKNRYGILEPEVNFSTLIDIIDLDIIFMPVVGFDKHGRRLGRGGAYYDSTFTAFHKHPLKKWPTLIGLAYRCQEVDEIPTDIWDWQLDIVVTEDRIFNCKEMLY